MQPQNSQIGKDSASVVPQAEVVAPDTQQSSAVPVKIGESLEIHQAPVVSASPAPIEPAVQVAESMQKTLPLVAAERSTTAPITPVERISFFSRIGLKNRNSFQGPQYLSVKDYFFRALKGVFALGILLIIATIAVSKMSTNQSNQTGQISTLSSGVFTGNATTGTTLSVNGAFEVRNTITIKPSTKPTTNTTGQMYFDQTTNKLYINNGQGFTELLTNAVTSLGGKTGSIVLGNGLAIDAQGRLGTTLTIPDQITYSAGSGITFDGTIIRNSGVLSINGTINQIDAVSVNGIVTLSLPQDISPLASPTFASIALTSSLDVASGGTGANTFAANGVLVGNGTGAITATAAGSSGQCLVANTGAAPTWQSCSAASGGAGSGAMYLTLGTDGSLTAERVLTAGSNIVTSDAGAKGAFTIGVSNSPIFSGTVTAGLFAGDGSSLTNLNASDLSSGTVPNARLSTNVTLQGNSFNGSSQLVQLNVLGQLPALDGSNLTNVNAALLNGNAASYYTNASNLSSGTVGSARVSGSYSGITGLGTVTVGTWQATTISPAYGGTGVNGAAAPNGALLIGNGTGYSLATLTANTGITITNGAGSIGIAVDNTVCTTAGNCTVGSGIGGGNAFMQNGNTFGSTAILGTNDNYGLSLKTNGSVKLAIDTNGNVGINNATPANKLNINTPTTADSAAQQVVYTNSTTNKGIVIQAVSGQTGNLQEWQSYTGGKLAYVDAYGGIYAAALGSPNQSGSYISLNNSQPITMTTPSSSQKVLIAKAAASQSVALQEWQDSNGNMLARITQTGKIIQSGGGNVFLSNGTWSSDGDNAWGGYVPVISVRAANNGYSGLNIFTTSGPAFRAYDGSGNPRGSWNGDGSIVIGQSNTSLGTLSVYNTAAGTVGAVIRGAASQSANIFEVQGGDTNAVFVVGPTGSVRANTGGSSFGGQMSIQPYSAGVKGLVVRGAVSQTGTLQEWQDSNGNPLVTIDSAGAGLFKNSADSSAALTVQNTAGNNVFNVNTTSGITEIGKSSTLTGIFRLYNSGGSGYVALQPANPSSTGYTLTLPAETGTLCTTGSVCSGYAAGSGSGNYIQNGTTPQTASFNITGTATVGGAATFSASGIAATISNGSLRVGVLGTGTNNVDVTNTYIKHVYNGTTDSRFFLTSNGTTGMGLPSGNDGGALALSSAGNSTILSGGGVGVAKFNMYVGSTTAPVMTALSNGNVGIGTTSPADLLVVQSASGAQARLTVVAGSTAQSHGIQMGWPGNTNAGIIRTDLNGTDGADVSIWTKADGGSVSEKLRVLGNGNVGIGDTTPAALLTVGNGDKFKVDANGMIKLGGSTTAFGNAYIDFSNNSGLSSASTVFGLLGEAQNGGAGSVTAIQNTAVSNYAGTVGSLKGAQFGVRSLNASTSVTNGYAIYAYRPTVTAGSITSAYGLCVDSQKVSGVTTGYGIYQADSADINYFAGKLAIGTTAAATRLLDVRESSGNIVVANMQSASATGSIVDIQNANAGANAILRTYTGSSGWKLGNNGGNSNAFTIESGVDAAFTSSAPFTILSGGNVGIGDTTPAALFTVGNGDKFQVDSAGSFIAQGNSAISTTTSGGQLSIMSTTGNQATIQFSQNSTLKFYHGLNSAGNYFMWDQAGGSSPMSVVSNGGLLSLGNATRDLQISSNAFNVTTAGAVTQTGSYAVSTYLQTAGGAGFRWTLNNDGTFRLQRTVDGFSTASGTPILVDSNNNVGIGVASPNALLTVGSAISTNITPVAIFDTTGTKPLFVGRTTSSTGLMIGYTGNDIQGRTGSNFATNGDININNYGGNVLLANGGGNVGIGTASPNYKLQVNGAMYQQSTGLVNYFDSEIRVNTGAAYNNVFSGSGLGIGTNAPSNLIHLKSAAPVIRLEDTDTSTSGWIDYTGGTALKLHAGPDAISFLAGNAERMNLSAAGNLGIGTTPISTSRLLVSTASGATGGYSNLNAQLTGSTGSINFGAYIYQSHSTASSAAEYNFGSQSNMIETVASGQTNSGYAIGVDAQAWLNNAAATGTLASSYGLRAQTGIYSGSAGTLSSATGISVDVVNLGSGTITTGYGIILNDVQATTGYGFYQSGSNDYNYFAGNVGLGVLNATRQLHVYGAGQAVRALTDAGNKGGTLYLQDSGGSVYNGGTILFGANQGNFAAIKAQILDGGANTIGDLSILTRQNTSDTALTERVTFAAQGNVGIGDTSPAALFTVGNGDLFQVSSGGNVTVGSSSGNGLTFSNTGITTDLVLQNGATIDNNTAGEINMTTGRLRLTGSRQFTATTTSGAVRVQGDSGGWAMSYGAYGSLGTDYSGFGFLGNADSLTYYYIGSSYASPSVAVLPSGNVGIGDSTPAALFTVGSGDLFQVSSTGVMSTNGTYISGTAGRNIFVDTEMPSGSGLRVGAAWGMYGIYAEQGNAVVGGAAGAVNLQNGGAIVTATSTTLGGSLSVATGITNSGGYTQTGSTPNTFSADTTFNGMVNINNATRIIYSTGTALDVENVSRESMLMVDGSLTLPQVLIGSGSGVDTMLTLDSVITEPSSGVSNGMMYYNSTLSRFRCYEGGHWINCTSGFSDRDSWGYRSKGTLLRAIGVGSAYHCQDSNGSATCTATESTASGYGQVENNTVDGTFTRFSVGTSGYKAGISGAAAANFTNVGMEPECSFKIKTDSDVTNMRVWVGLFYNSAGASSEQNVPPNSTTGTNVQALGFMGNAGTWQVMTNAGSASYNSSVSPALANSTMAANTVYTFKIRVIGSTAYFSINGGAESSTSTQIPSSAQDLGFAMMFYTTGGGTRYLNLGRMACMQD